MLWFMLSLVAFGAIVNGPLFSLDASGAVGRALVYTKWKGRNVVREYVTPANPNSLAQRARRQMMALLNVLWQGMDSTQRQSWENLAAASNISTFNAFCSWNLNLQTDDDAPIVDRFNPSATIASSISAVAGSGGLNQVEVDVTIATPTAGEYLLLGLQEAPSTNPENLNNLLFFGEVTELPGDPPTAVLENIPAGNYNVGGIIINAQGAKSVGSDDGPFVVTGTT